MPSFNILVQNVKSGVVAEMTQLTCGEYAADVPRAKQVALASPPDSRWQGVRPASPAHQNAWFTPTA